MDGVLWAAFFIMAIAMLGLFKPVLSIIFTVAGVIVVSLLGIVSMTIVSVISIVLIGFILAWEMRK